MYLTIAVIAGLLIGIPGGMYWLLRPRKEVPPGPFHNDSGPSIGGGPVDPGGHP
jgi:hypothetical protein